MVLEQGGDTILYLNLRQWPLVLKEQKDRVVLLNLSLPSSRTVDMLWNIKVRLFIYLFKFFISFYIPNTVLPPTPLTSSYPSSRSPQAPPSPLFLMGECSPEESSYSDIIGWGRARPLSQALRMITALHHREWAPTSQLMFQVCILVLLPGPLW